MTVLKSNDKIIENDIEKSEIFAKYFSSVFQFDDGILPNFLQRVQTNLTQLDLSLGAVLQAISELNDKLSTTLKTFHPFL